MLDRRQMSGRVGVAIVGLGGAVATTTVAGIELLRHGLIGYEGLPLANAAPEAVDQLVAYEQLVFAGWDLAADDLRRAAATHNVLTAEQLTQVGDALERVKPWPAAGNAQFCRNIDGQHRVLAETHREVIAIIHDNLRRFRQEAELEGLVLVNLASTERQVDTTLPHYQSIEAFESALDQNVPEIGPAMLYAYAALIEHVPYVNFTPSVAADIPALIELAERENVPVAGKDGKTGQTMMKTVIAPALRTRALRVDG